MTHLLSDGDQPLREFQARCGHLLPKAAAVHDQPLRRKCIQCDLLFLADTYAPDGFSQQGQDHATEARGESRLLDPADDEHVSLEPHLHCVRLPDNRFHWVVLLGTPRRRDQLTEHLDTAQSTEADCSGCGTTHGVQPKPAPPQVAAWICTVRGLHGATTTINPALSMMSLLPTPQLRTAAFLATLGTEVTTGELGVPKVGAVDELSACEIGVIELTLRQEEPKEKRPYQAGIRRSLVSASAESRGCPLSWNQTGSSSRPHSFLGMVGDAFPCAAYQATAA